MAADRDWDRLAEATRERRVELGLTQEDVRAAGGPSTATMRLIEGALQHGYQPATLRDLEQALRWERGSVGRLLDGGDPVPLGGTPSRPQVGTVAPLGRSGESFLTGQDMAAQMQPHVAEVEGRLAVWASGAALQRGESALGEIPDGHTVFPDLPEDARRWDLLVEQGFLGEKFTLWQLTQAIAIARVRDEERRQKKRGDAAAAG